MNKPVIKNDLTWASIVPLIGGESIGLMQALGGKLPEYILSYPAFAKNDAHLIQYLKKKGWDDNKYIVLENSDVGIKTELDFKLKQVDIVNVVAPCAGLSSLNVKSGHGCPANDWMYLTAEFTLKNIKPKVFWGENAPRLGTKAGEPVKDQLVRIAKKYGYSFSLYKTSSYLHGVCQKRPRTFYFFWKDVSAPEMEYYNNPLVGYKKTLGKLSKRDKMAVPTNSNPDAKPTDSPYYRYLLEVVHKTDHASYIKSLEDPVSVIFEVQKQDGHFRNFTKWCFDNGFDKIARRAEAMQEKLDDNKGYWGHGLTAVPADGIAPAYIGAQPYGLLHPVEDRFLTIREGLRIMGMPDDFNLIGGRMAVNHICQNVPVRTAQDMAEQTIKFCKGKLKSSNSPVLIQDNYKQKIEYAVQPSNTYSLAAYLKK